MPNYLLAYHGGETPEGEEAQAKMMTAWNEWIEQHGDAMIDIGNPVGATMTVAADGTATDGAGEHAITGYSVVEADDMPAAVEIAKSCPVLADGGSVEVAELVEIPTGDDDEDDEEDEE